LEGTAGIETDVCIVGAGAAGITVAMELIDSGRDLCLLESGGLEPDEATQSLHEIDSIGYPVRENFMSRARYFGGSCNIWAGRNMGLTDLDFEARPWVPDSGWPVSHAEVASLYPRASRLLGSPEPAQFKPQALQGRMSRAESALFGDGLLTPTCSVWGRRPMRFGDVHRKALRAARNVRVVLNASATRISMNEAGTAIESVEARTLDGRRTTVRARHFVLACGGLENARLLLVSRDRHSAGIGNQRDLVGRCFMDHPRAVFGKVHLAAGAGVPLLRGRPLPDGKLQVGIGMDAELQRREGLLNHYVTFEEMTSGYVEAKYQSVIQTAKVVMRRGHAGSRWDFARKHLAEIPDMIYLLSPKELMPHGAYRAYVAVKDLAARRPKPRTYVAVYFCEQPPDRESRVALGDAKDHLGIPRLVLHWRIPESVRDSVLRMQQLLASRLEATGVGRLEAGEGELRFTDASHHMGTTRMGRTPADGVVNSDCRVHGVANLYLAGSSVFPTAGHANPTLTLVALSIRLAAHLRERMNERMESAA
jgi:choline dehydrogenase-like flavoprotein